MPKQANPEMLDDINPEWTAEDFRNARPAAVVLPELFGPVAAQAMLKPRGRPPAASVKVRTTIRLSPEVIESFRADGAGWQTRIDAALKDWLQTHSAR